MRAPRPCIEPGCPEYVTEGVSRCERHATVHEAKRRSQGQKIGRRSGTSEWRRIRAHVLRRDRNRCVACGASGDLMVHHVDGDPSNNSLGNLQALCYPCHRLADDAIRRARKGSYR